jgi:heptosyltransferase-2
MMRKILVIAPNWIGDALMAQPLFAQIKARHPRVQIHAIAPKWVAPVLARMPEITRVLPTELAHGKLQLGSRTAGIPLRIGYKGETRVGVLNVRYPNPPKKARPPMVQHYAALAFKPGAKLPDTLPDPHLQVDVQRVAATSAKFGIAGNARLVAFCPGAEYGPAKRWPAEHFAELAQMLRRSFPYAQIIALGSGKDREMANAIVERAPFVRNLCGETSLDEAIELLARAEAAICNDSGLMHVTAALGRPQVAVFGSSDPRHTPPLSPAASIMWLHLECSPCFARECPLGHLRCLRDIGPEMVFHELRRLLQPV